MTLTARLLAFFFGTLVLVLAGFSGAVYWFAHDHLYQQAEERLASAMVTLSAAIEVSEEGVEWDRPTQPPDLGEAGASVAWRVADDRGDIFNQSTNRPDVLNVRGDGTADHRDSRGEPWRVTRRWLRPDRLRSGKLAPDKYPAIQVVVAIPLGPVEAVLRRLAVCLVGLSAGVLGVAILVGRVICRRALAPVTRMAVAARGMGAADFTERLPVAPAEDELADLGRSFNGLLDRLHESFERQRRFTGEAAHQLRTPLAAVLGQAEVAVRRERPAGEYREALDSVRRQAGHLQRIVDALLFLARADAEAGPPAADRLDLAAWLPDHLRTWADHARAADIRVEAADGPARVHAPPALLGELANNLIDNALKYSDAGTPVTLRLGHDAGRVSLSVEDRGHGIDAGDLPHLFRPFFRSADARRRGVPGVGLGLAVAARLAKAFGGDLTATSEPGRGSCFRVRLPQAP